MTTFNFSRFLRTAAKKDESGNINSRLEDYRKDAPETLTEKQIDKDRKTEGETTTEERLEKVRTGSGDKLVEGLLNTSKSTLHQHRNEDASKGDINKLEELRLARKDVQEKEKQELASETGKKNRLLDYDTSKDDGLKLASPTWDFVKTSMVVNKKAPEAMFYCRECGTAYDDKPKPDVNGRACEKCGGNKIDRIPGRYYKPAPGFCRDVPTQLDPTKPMPKLQSFKDGLVSLAWDFATSTSVEDDFTEKEQAAKTMVDGIGDIQPGGEFETTEVDEDDDGNDFPPEFLEQVVGRSSATGTKMETIEVICTNPGKYENEDGQMDEDGRDRMIADIMAFLANEHPEMSSMLTSKMLNISKILDGKVYYSRPM